jgi:hypothetical protein
MNKTRPAETTEPACAGSSVVLGPVSAEKISALTEFQGPYFFLEAFFLPFFFALAMLASPVTG